MPGDNIPFCEAPKPLRLLGLVPLSICCGCLFIPPLLIKFGTQCDPNRGNGFPLKGFWWTFIHLAGRARSALHGSNSVLPEPQKWSGILEYILPGAQTRPKPTSYPCKKARKGRGSSFKGARPCNLRRKALIEQSYKRETISEVPSSFLWFPMICFGVAS